MRSCANPLKIPPRLSTRRLTTTLKLFCLCFGLIAGTSHAGQPQQDASIETRLDWLSPPPCSLEHATSMPFQPQIGLALFKFECPSEPTKFSTAKISRKAWGLLAQRDIAKGEKLTSEMFGPDPRTMWISRQQDFPLTPERALAVQAKLPVSAGTRLLARDFENRRLWIGGEAIMISLEQSNLTTTMPGISLGVGKLGEGSSAKSETGKNFNGIAALCDQTPCLKVNF